jgi:hypothetical protein
VTTEINKRLLTGCSEVIVLQRYSADFVNCNNPEKIAAIVAGDFVMDAEFDLALTAGREEADDFLFRFRLGSALHGQRDTPGNGGWRGVGG